MAEAVLTAEGLAAGYGPARVLFGVDLSLAAGEVAALLGRNGAGKSTTLKALMGLLPPRAGRVRLLGRDVTGWPPHRVARAGLGWVPEDRRVFADLTVDENLAVGRKPGPGPAWTPERLFAVFPDLAAMRGRRAGRMSGGEQQMLAVARTLMGAPLAVLLDEPSEGLAPLVVERMAGAVAEMRRAGCAVLLCEQNLDFAASVADRALVLERGAVVHEGAVDSPEVEALLAAA